MTDRMQKKQSENSRKKMEHKMYLAHENPEPVFDLSECELSEIPAKIFAQCKLLRKERLLLHDNYIHSLTSGGGKLQDLFALRELDLQKNRLQQLPNEIDLLKSLQILNVSHNSLKTLPDSIGNLKCLRVLKVQANQLVSLPESIGSLASLQQLLLDCNPLTTLPRSLARLSATLGVLQLPQDSLDSFVYPPAHVVKEGTTNIMKFLCEESGIRLEVDIPAIASNGSLLTIPHGISLSKSSDCLASEQARWGYERQQEEKRKRLLALERQLQLDRETHMKLTQKMNSEKLTSLDRLVEEEARMMQELARLHAGRDAAHQLLVTSLQSRTDLELVQQLTLLNESAKRREAILEYMEKERAGAEKWFLVRQEDANCLRRMEVLNAMHAQLSEVQAVEQRQLRMFSQQVHALHSANEDQTRASNIIDGHLNQRQAIHGQMIERLAKEQELQKQAFSQLQVQKDFCLQRIRQEMALIEEELRRLSLAEVERGVRKWHSNVSLLAERRAQLIQLYLQLREEKDARVEELRRRLMEMEAARAQDQVDYWLIQYQRLLDRKPQALFDQKNEVERAVYDILVAAKALDCLPTFQRHRVSIETLCGLGDEGLLRLGVKSAGCRQKILHEVAQYQKRAANAAPPELNPPQPLRASSSATTSPKISAKSASRSQKTEEDHQNFEVALAYTEPTTVQAHVEVVCCVCLNRESSVLFLGCGHICCCAPCAEPLSECPLCRLVVTHKVVITSATATK